MKRLVCVMILFSLVCTTTVFAEETGLPGRNDDNQVVVDVEYVGNGIYIETVIFDDEFADSSLAKGIMPLASKTVTKSKAYNYKNAAGEIMWYVKVTGTFTYGNGSAKCTASTPSAKSNEKRWTVSKVTGKRSNNWCSATTTAKQKSLLGITDKTVTENLLTKVKYFSSKMEYIFTRIFCVQQNDRRRFRPAGRSAMLY